jgi:hypothetical protein
MGCAVATPVAMPRAGLRDRPRRHPNGRAVLKTPILTPNHVRAEDRSREASPQR